MNPLSFDHSLRLARGHRSTRAITPSPTFFVRIFVVRLRRPIRTTSDNRESSQGPPPPGLGFKKGREGNPFYHRSSGNFDDGGARLPVFYGTKRGFSRVTESSISPTTFQHFVRDTALFTCVYEYGGFEKKGKSLFFDR